MSIRIILADDHVIVRKGLLSILEEENDIEIVAEANDGREAVSLADEKQPDIIVMDISMPNMNGLEATRQIKEKYPQIKILILTVLTNEEYISQILKVGASGYIIKKAAPEELISAIRIVNQGKKYLSPSISDYVISGLLTKTDDGDGKLSGPDVLTAREKEVLQLIAEGISTKDIAAELFLSVKTIETHRKHLMHKLNLFTIADLTKYAIRHGITDLD